MTRLRYIVLALAGLHLAIAVGKVAAWRDVVLVTWRSAFLTADAAKMLTLMGVIANATIGFVFLNARNRLHQIAVVSAGLCAFGVMIHGYVFVTGELVAAGCAARVLAPAGSGVRSILFATGCVLFVLSAIVALAPEDAGGIEHTKRDEPESLADP